MSRTVVITGASSFIGAHLALAFAHDGWRVAATHTHPPQHYEGIRDLRLSTVREQAELVPLDMTDGKAVHALIQRLAPDLWVQHAGHALDYGGFAYDFAKGLHLNAAVLSPLYEALSKGDCGVILTGTCAEYGVQTRPDQEDDPCLPETPYGLVKLAGTLAARQLARHYGVPTRAARVYIPFGPMDAPGKLLPQVIAALSKGEPVALSPCDQVRDFLAVDVLCAGYLALARDLTDAPKRAEGFDLFNLCSGEGRTLRDLLVHLADLLDAPHTLLRFGERPMRPGEPAYSVGDPARAQERLGWRPEEPEQGLRRLLEEMMEP